MNPSEPSLFEIRNLTVAYDRRPVLEDVDLTIPAGKLVAIVGPNGAGKSTLIKAALGLIPRLSGAFFAFGKPFGRADARIGYVPQRESVDWDFPVSVMDVALMGTYGRVGWMRRPGKTERLAAEHALEAVGMREFARRQISQLSGGQQQRTFLARALAQDASLYFMDEPLAGVDHATERAIIDLLRGLRSRGRTAVVVHHDLQTVPEYFDEVVLLNKRIIASGPIEQAFTATALHEAYGGKLLTLGPLAPEAPSEAVREVRSER